MGCGPGSSEDRTGPCGVRSSSIGERFPGEITVTSPPQSHPGPQSPHSPEDDVEARVLQAMLWVGGQQN